MPYFSDQLQESLAIGAVWGAYRGIESYGKKQYHFDIPIGLKEELNAFDSAEVAAKAFGAAASGLYAYHLLAGHIPNTTPLWMRTHVKT